MLGTSFPVAKIASSEAIGHGYFAPVEPNAIEALLDECAQQSTHIERTALLANTLLGENASTLRYFADGNLDKNNARLDSALFTKLFEREGAIASLHADYWQRAIALTDVLDHMPQNRRNSWAELIRSNTTPAFERETVFSTLRELLWSREKFLAERVEGIFNALSPKHLTNSPMGFGARMILARMFSEYGHLAYERAGYINDLRCVIARLQGRGNGPSHGSTDDILRTALREHRGEWLTLDGGALRVRAYQVGTVHVEIHPDIAWKLNAILATLHPNAIPARFRTKPEKKPKDFVLMDRPLPFDVLNIIQTLGVGMKLNPVTQRGERDSFCRIFGYQAMPEDKALLNAVVDVMQSLGAVYIRQKFVFDYDPEQALRELLRSGCLPDQKSHQFYPTPAALAEQVIEHAGIESHHRCLEPSAGQGNLAVLMPKDQTVCCEVSAMHAEILRSKGLDVVQQDFLQWADQCAAAGRFFDRIIMNPPYSQGRAQLHLDAARKILAPGGRIVAVLPSGFGNREAPSGWNYHCSQAIEGAFQGTSISVVILVAERSTS
ncbi:class I SAM-dependent methyltransferase [Sinimarinibacterium sp. NLF-5-8]|uniref:class I SAM-dependent methyltransferase n=1 Tax=Sinimarinibacterium sp. NLF-5-8 TaxID=2698684 RepID=UPI00137C27EF|nr:class I SAM-dependent methyltransferase [Sinimarinibacterium sp. NLF-5-8]QHS09125.1 DUF4942 domain-containing protein [Sinimarinibacterium sp. NLF-5-8]